MRLFLIPERYSSLKIASFLNLRVLFSSLPIAIKYRWFRLPIRANFDGGEVIDKNSKLSYSQLTFHRGATFPIDRASSHPASEIVHTSCQPAYKPGHFLPLEWYFNPEIYRSPIRNLIGVN